MHRKILRAIISPRRCRMRREKLNYRQIKSKFLLLHQVKFAHTIIHQTWCLTVFWFERRLFVSLYSSCGLRVSIIYTINSRSKISAVFFQLCKRMQKAQFNCSHQAFHDWPIKKPCLRYTVKLLVWHNLVYLLLVTVAYIDKRYDSCFDPSLVQVYLAYGDLYIYIYLLVNGEWMLLE